MLLVLAVLPLTAPAIPAGSPYKVKEIFNAPHGWQATNVPLPSHTIELQIGLTQPNFYLLEQHLYEISDPAHDRYGQHLTKDQVDELVAPHDDALALVNEWLGTYGIQDENIARSSARDWIRVTLPVEQVETMLDTTYHVWSHTDGTELVRTTHFSLPDFLHPHIDVVQPTTLFGRWKGMGSGAMIEETLEYAKTISSQPLGLQVDPSCSSTITVSCLLQLYNATDFVPSGQDNSIGITGYLEQNANLADLQSFYADQVPRAVNSSFELVTINGGENNQDPALAGVEANLDVQFAFGIANPIPATFYSTGGRPPIIPENATNTNEPYIEWLDYVLSHPDPPKVISTSYGESEQSVPESYARRVCNGFAQLGARGVTLTFSSGDGGVGDGNANPDTHNCFSNDGQNTEKFLPLFPAGCPFVTAIGGTVDVPEVAVSFSGGGFSDYFERPSYQDKVVPAYINSLAPGTYAGLFNTSGRGIPDIAAQGRRYRVWYQNRTISVGGTSASSPTAAGIIALLNDARISNGKSSLGFINPLLYQMKSVRDTFNDIAIGNNPGCGTQGFNATEGWDPVTGFGTPNFGLLRDIILSF